ncbi:MAG TPA: cytochrome C [Myxococcales bacterium]|nr:cytochrome C [Myxococcales bacterium]
MTKSRFGTYMAAAIAVAGFAPSAKAFHSGGVGECEGCHTMHNSIGNAPVGREGGGALGSGVLYQGGKFLLKGSDQSSTCLSCHNQPDLAPSSYHISTDDSIFGGPNVVNPTTPPTERTPGGDFAWLKMTFTYTVRGTPQTDAGQGHGHNIVAADFNYTADSELTHAPGNGATAGYPATALACSSCHDPHGKYRRLADGAASVKSGGLIYSSGSTGALPKNGWAVGVYRLLGGVGYAPKSLGTDGATYAFRADSPFAVSPSSYNRDEASSAGVVAQTHVAYGAGMSEWCQNCHAAMHNDTYTSGVAGQVHPAGNGAKLTQAIVDNYNSWVSSGIAGTQGFSSLAPFEEGETTSALLAPHAVNTRTPATDIQATTSNNVMCLTCHRAHASGFPESMRFFLENEFMTVANATTGAAEYDGTDGLNGSEGKIHFGRTKAMTQAAYYNRPAAFFGPWARNYCNKCHAKD